MEKNMEHAKARPCMGTQWGKRRSASLQRIMVSALFGVMILTTPSTKAEAQNICESLKSFTSPHATLTSISLHPGGKYVSTDAILT